MPDVAALVCRPEAFGNHDPADLVDGHFHVVDGTIKLGTTSQSGWETSPGHRLTYQPMKTFLGRSISSRPARPPSRPNPLCFTPPKGAVGDPGGNP